jgi:predicted membrane-bound mannosyltransferase
VIHQAGPEATCASAMLLQSLAIPVVACMCCFNSTPRQALLAAEAVVLQLHISVHVYIYIAVECSARGLHAAESLTCAGVGCLGSCLWVHLQAVRMLPHYLRRHNSLAAALAVGGVFVTHAHLPAGAEADGALRAGD